MRGGGDGAKGEMTLHPVAGAAFEAPPYGLRDLGPARLHASSPAGGGWGDPLKRDPEAVERDVLDGIVSREAAAALYGVVLQEDGSLNEEATIAFRRKAAEAP